MKPVLNWLAGKKTYIAAGVLAALGLFAMLDRNPANDFVGMGLIMIGLGLCALHAQAERLYGEIIERLRR